MKINKVTTKHTDSETEYFASTIWDQLEEYDYEGLASSRSLVINKAWDAESDAIAEKALKEIEKLYVKGEINQKTYAEALEYFDFDKSGVYNAENLRVIEKENYNVKVWSADYEIYHITDAGEETDELAYSITAELYEKELHWDLED